MMRASHQQPGFLAALMHRLSGIALAIFLPIHFLALAAALGGAGELDTFLAVSRNPFVKLSEFALIVALAAHMTLGLRVLAIEFLDVRENTRAALAACLGVVLAVGLLFLVNAG
jgi:fumarate reductase subunit D